MATIRPLVVISQPIPPSALERLRTFADVGMGEDSSRIMARADLLERVRRAGVFFHLMHDLVFPTSAIFLLPVASGARIPRCTAVRGRKPKRSTVWSSGDGRMVRHRTYRESGDRGGRIGGLFSLRSF